MRFTFGSSHLVSVALLVTAISCGGSSGSGGTDGGSGGRTGGPSGSGGSTSGGTGGAAGQPVDSASFCLAEVRALCDLIFQCVPAADRDADFIATLGSTVAECKDTVAARNCATAAAECPRYNATYGSACLMTLAVYTCAELVDPGEPSECARACESNGTGGASGTGGSSATGGRAGTGGRPGTGGGSASGGRPGTGGGSASGGRMGTGGGSASGGADGQLPLCPADYATASCPVPGQSCRIDAPSGLAGCTCQTLGDRMLWSCIIF